MNACLLPVVGQNSSPHAWQVAALSRHRQRHPVQLRALGSDSSDPRSRLTSNNGHPLLHPRLVESCPVRAGPQSQH